MPALQVTDSPGSKFAKYLALNGEYVPHNDSRFGNDGPAVYDEDTGFCFSARQVFIPVNSRKNSAFDFAKCTPDSVRMSDGAAEGIRSHGHIVPARLGYFLWTRDNDTPAECRAWAVSKYRGLAVLVRVTKSAGTHSIYVPYWAAVETDGSYVVDSDGRAYLKLSQGQYGLFWQGRQKPEIGTDKIAFADRYPKETVSAGNGISGTYDFSTAALFNSPVSGLNSVDISLGYGPDLNWGFQGLGQFVRDGADSRRNIFVGGGFLFQQSRGTTTNCIQQNAGGLNSNAQIQAVYQDDTGVNSAGNQTFQENGRLAGRMIVFGSPTTPNIGGIAVEWQQNLSGTNTASYGLLARDRYFRMWQLDTPESGRIQMTCGEYFIATSATAFTNFDEGGSTVGYSIKCDPMAAGESVPSAVDYYNGTWNAGSMTAGYHWISPAHGIRSTHTATAGNAYKFGKVVYLIRPSSLAAQNGKVAWNTTLTHTFLYNAGISGRSVALGERWGQKVVCVYSGSTGTTYSEANPASPTDNIENTSEIDGYFGGFAQQ